MSNHYHMLVQTPDANLSKSMRHLNGVYTQRYNSRHECDGQLFRGRYKSILIDTDRTVRSVCVRMSKSLREDKELAEKIKMVKAELKKSQEWARSLYLINRCNYI
jgi:REP element-mobilizing transposase RayT